MSIVLVFILSLSLCQVSMATEATVEVEVFGAEHYDMAWEILDIVNQERSALGAAPLTMDESLMDYAMLRSAECAVYYSHTRPDGTLSLEGCKAENIAAKFYSAEEVMKAWMASTGHRGNIINTENKSIGIGVYEVAGQGFYYTQIFAESAAGAEPIRSNGMVDKPHTIPVDLAIAKLALSSYQPDTSYNLHIGETMNLDLPPVYVETGEWSASVWIDQRDLTCKMADSTIATMTSVNTELRLKVSLTAKKVGSTTLNVYIPGAEANALTIPVHVSAHNYVSKIVPPCTTKGYTEYTCSICDHTYRSNETEMTGHAYVLEHTGEGYKKYVCSQCGEENIKYSQNFADVSKENWFYSPVMFVSERGIMTGLNQTLFGANENLARAQFAALLYKLEGSPAVAYESRFSDVADGQWYTKPILWAAQNGIVNGYQDGRFGVGDSINREQIATMLYSYSKFKGYDLSQSGDLSGFPDNSSVSAYAKNPLQWAVGVGFISGTNGKLDPQGSAVRAQCAAIMMRYLNAYCV
ncbi:S-layer homology domain-containing protein [Ohessyouella blattaphilus]|uniref:S-layer homology domain-containing protein n=1 Tax=Ohessyouella blattaphilus TaxID=2949333 RepID=A0ABT1EDQ4_9FIRM|nr:S-layer homology domain-containing protein [Ohessyouella blattaphilus]MCP1108634.1 S-layer homology domain-containing protein [Ohessyouella blattaphilus]MCR8562028.1 S-layer homology domain-containing protein [Ohessyouella blattaphilus]